MATVKEVTVLEGVTLTYKALKRNLSFRRRRCVATAATQTPSVVDSETSTESNKTMMSRKSSYMLPGLAPRASAVRAALSPLTTSPRRRQSVSPRPPPRASDVRSAMEPLYGGKALEIARSTRGLTRSPDQPTTLVGIVRRASLSDYKSRRSSDALAQWLRRASIPGPPPRASDVRAAVTVSATRTWSFRRDSLPQKPPRASDVRAAVTMSPTRTGSFRRDSLPQKPPRASDVRAAVSLVPNQERRERRRGRRFTSGASLDRRLSLSFRSK